MKLKIIIMSGALASLLLMSGCAGKEAGVATNTGFFEDYTKTTTQTVIKPAAVVYTKINVAPVKVVSGILQETPSQKKMYKEIEEYLMSEYKKIVQASKRYTLSDTKSVDTLVLQSAISTVEVHYDDAQWRQHTPIAMGLDTISFNAYMYEFVRILGESKLVDSTTGKVLSRTMKIQKNDKIKITGDDLVFKDIKPALDSWLAQVKADLSSK
ncbi:MAG: DUF3313 family protein [Sulfurimonas sp.]|nr:DUF3313 family protein [Sulfurimonas sp.]